MTTRIAGKFVGEFELTELPDDGEEPPPDGALRREECGPQTRTEPWPQPPAMSGVAISPTTDWRVIRDAEPGVPLDMTAGVYPWRKRYMPSGVDLRALLGAVCEGAGSDRLFMLEGTANDLIEIVASGYGGVSPHNGTVHWAHGSEGGALWSPRITDSGEEAVHMGGRAHRIVGGELVNARKVTINGGGADHLIDGVTIRGGASYAAIKFGQASGGRIVYVTAYDVGGPLAWLDVKCSDWEVAHGSGYGGDDAGVHFEIGAGGNRAHHMEFYDFGRLRDGVSGGWRNQRHQGAALLIHNSPGDEIDHCYVEVAGDYGAGGCIWDQHAAGKRGPGTPNVSDGSSFHHNWLEVSGEPRGRGWLMGVRGVAVDRVSVHHNIYVLPPGWGDWPGFRLEGDYVPGATWLQAFPDDEIREAAA